MKPLHVRLIATLLVVVIVLFTVAGLFVLQIEFDGLWGSQQNELPNPKGTASAALLLLAALLTWFVVRWGWKKRG